MNSVEEPLEGENSVDPGELSWENHSPNSYLTKERTTLLSNSSSLEEINTGFDMTSLKQDASPQKPKSCILSFEDSTSVPITSKKTCQLYHGEHSKETQEKPHNRKPLKRGRRFSQTLDHILAERKRRENISRMFIALSALIPDLKKVSSYVLFTF